MALTIVINEIFFNLCCAYFFTFGYLNNIQLIYYYAYVQKMEFFIFLFCRSRITLMYFPKIYTILNIVFIIYCQTHFYPFVSEALFILEFVSMLVLVCFMLYIELPAFNRNPFSPHAQTVDNPRQTYIPVLRSNFTLGFDLWTSFYSPGLRTEFDSEEQAFLNEGMNESMFEFGMRNENEPEQNEGEELLII